MIDVIVSVLFGVDVGPLIGRFINSSITILSIIHLVLLNDLELELF